MGFDNECIVDIYQYPGEYFCPLCRTLVYPNEALQSQCTHLYCKYCLAYVANGTRACPYDGYLVTESDSKPLVESEKALAEKIGKIKVHCLYVRSGCTWEGALWESVSHCSECFFGNWAVVCNRCGMNFLHKQANEHARVCVYGCVAQQAAPCGVNATGLSANTAQTSTTYQQLSGNRQPPVQTQEHWWYQQHHHLYPAYNASQTRQGQDQPQAQVLPQWQAHLEPIQSPATNYQFPHTSTIRPQTQLPQPQQYSQQKPPNVPFEGQSHQQGHVPQQPIRPCGPPPQPHQLQNYTGRPMTPNQGPHPQTIAQSSCNVTVPHTAPVQVGSKLTSINENNAETRLEQSTIEKEPRKPTKKGSELQSMRNNATEMVERRAYAAHDMLPSDREFSGVPSRVSGEGSRFSNPSPVSFYGGRFPPSFDHLRRGSVDGHMGPPISNSHNTRGDFGRREGFAGPGREHNYEFHTGSSHVMRNHYTDQGLRNALNLKGGPESFGLSRRRPTSMGWCRLCQVDCETIVELEIHSQTRQHQNIAMDTVKTIKQQNQRASRGRISRGTGSFRNVGHEN